VQHKVTFKFAQARRTKGEDAAERERRAGRLAEQWLRGMHTRLRSRGECRRHGNTDDSAERLRRQQQRPFNAVLLHRRMLVVVVSSRVE
jgi:hypothetical protein